MTSLLSMTNPSDETRPRTGIRILLVEDDPGSQELIRALCERRGDRVEIAADGFQGLRCLSDGHHDVALIDYHLPEMDGYALARLMKEMPRPSGRLHLVGITADRHGLAARRGADRLFDAILVKPLQPDQLYATLDRLAAPEAVPLPPDPADEIWARRGLRARPAALLYSEDASRHREALSQAFRIVAQPEAADVVLVADEAGLDPLRALRRSGPHGFLPSVALSDRLAPACDLVFQVGDPEAWTALATASRGFRERRAALGPGAGGDATGRLLALLVVADRGLTLHRDPTSFAYETGDTLAEQMAAVLALARAGLVRCEPHSEGMRVHLTDAGRARMRQGTPGPTTHDPAPEAPAGWSAPSIEAGPEPSRSWASPRVAEQLPARARPSEASDVVDPQTMTELARLIGTDQVERLKNRLAEMLATTLREGADAALLAREAHILISAAGSLGFDTLAARCRALETAIHACEDHGGALDEARRAARAAMRVLNPIAAGRG